MIRPAQPLRPRRGGRRFRSTYLRLERLDDRAVPAVIAWDGGPTGNGTHWLDAANWRDAAGIDALPTAADDVTLDATGASPTIVLGNSTAVRSITSTRALQLTGGTLTLGA